MRPCDKIGGCLDRATCNGCDEPEGDELRELALKYQQAAAKCGTQAMRMGFALAIIREWSMNNWHAGAIITVRDWIDSGMTGPVPWPGGAIFEAWAEKQGWSNQGGFIGYTMTVQLNRSAKQ